MDFCVVDTPEELERDKVLLKGTFFDRNIVDFIDFITFEEYYLTSYRYNNSLFSGFNIFSLQPRGDTINAYFLEDKAVKLC